MEALAQGWRGGRAGVCIGPPPDDGAPFVVWGQQFLGVGLVRDAIASGRPFWHVDNGWFQSAKGSATGYYRFTYRGLTPHMLAAPDMDRLSVQMKPWRASGRHVVFAMPGQHFGAALGIDNDEWARRARRRLHGLTSRQIVVRHKSTGRPIEDELRHCWALVTHSSGVAVDAVRLGIPVFVEPTCAAAAVGNTDIEQIERPAMPDRARWWASLMNQQFTIEEMHDGTAFRYLDQVREQVDG